MNSEEVKCFEEIIQKLLKNDASYKVERFEIKSKAEDRVRDLNITKADEKQWERFCSALSNNTSLQEIIISSIPLHKIKYQNLQMFLEALNKNNNIKELRIEHISNFISLIDMKPWILFCNFIGNNKKISILSLRHCQLGSTAIIKQRPFFQAIAQNKSLKYLDLGSNELELFQPDEWKNFAEALRQNNTLKVLYMYDSKLCRTYENFYNVFDENNWNQFCNLIRTTPTRRIDLQNNDIHHMKEAPWKTFLEAAQANSNLFWISLLAGHGKGDPRLDALGEIMHSHKVDRHQKALAAAHSLTSLKLKENGITPRTLPNNIAKKILLMLFDDIPLNEQVMIELEDHRKRKTP